MDESPNRIQEQQGSVTDRKPTWPEASGPLVEDVNAATKRPQSQPLVESGSEANSGLRRRDTIWPEIHSPTNDVESDNIDPRAGGDPVGER